jgi:tetratricopeptide (TPR) repeat protein
MSWFILGIEPTKDKKAITNAYRQKLRQTNPEDKPEEFKALRTAYEEALAFANQEDAAPVRDESPVGLWMEAIEKLYEDYASRINPACWEPLMGSDVCIGLDTRPAAEEALMKFLMENYHLPKAVWLVLDQTFQFRARVEELHETWPRDFIDHVVLMGIRFDPALDYALFMPGISGKDCDAYRKLYFHANQMPLNEIAPILEQMDALSERHPYGEALRYRFYLETGREQEGKDGLRKLFANYPDNAFLGIVWAELCLEDGNADEAIRIASHVLDLTPKHIGAKTVYAKCLAEKKQYHEAKECAYEIMHASGENPILKEQMADLMKAWNEELIRQREAVYAASPEDADNAIELAWCYAQNDRVEDAMALAQKIDPNCEDAFSYHNLMGKLYHNTGKYAEALPHMQAVETVLRNMTDDGTTKVRKSTARLPEMLQIQGNCLTQLGRTAEAKAKFEQALEIAPENTEVLSLMGRILFASGDYAYAVEIFRQLLQLSPGAWYAEMLMTLSLYRMRQDREAFDAINRAIAIQGNELSLYIIKMQILIRNEVFEEVHEILNLLKECGAPEDVSTDFIRAQLTQLEKKDAKNALKQYQALQKRVESGEDLIFGAELYYHLAVLTGNQLDVSQESNRKTVLEIVDTGLSYNEQDTDLLAYKVWVLKKGGLHQEAIAMYQALLEKNPHSPAALRGIADMYYEDLNYHAEDALSYYEKLLENRKTAELYFFAATCKRHLGDWEGARLYYLKELEMDPEDVDGLRGLAFICESQGKYTESLELLDQALAIMEQYSNSYDWMVEHKAKVLRRLGRYEEALAFAEEAANRYHFGGSLQLQFDICCQAGLWDRAKQVLDRWKQVNRNDPDLMAANGTLNLLQGKMFKAVLAMGPAKHKLPFEQVQDFRLQLADLECNHQRQVEIWSRRVQENPKDDHAMVSLAHAYWHMGKMKASQGAAQKALALLDEKLSQHSTEEALYRSRRCLALALLGRSEEAKEELAKTRKLPLCDFCEYGYCKDADIYEAAIEEILGNTDTAKKLYTAGRTNWPDDLDFAAGEIRIKKKKGRQ